MASARARLGAARRRIIGRQKKARVAKGMFETAATVSSFVGAQAKKGQTAWDEYEAGYKELGGTDFQKPKFGQKGFFKGPSGEVTINKRVYDAGQVRKAGAFLGSDAASILDEGQRKQYLQRTAPTSTKEVTFTSNLKFDRSGGIGASTGFGEGSSIGFQPNIPAITSEHTPIITSLQESKKNLIAKSKFAPRLEDLRGPSGGFKGAGQGSGIGFQAQDTTSQHTPSWDKQQQYKIKGDIRQKKISDWQEAGSPMDFPKDMGIRDKGTTDFAQPQQIPVQDQSQSFLQKMQQGITQKFSDIGVRKWQKGQQRKSLWEREDPNDPSSPYKGGSYAKGGSFITNGPQMIMVGDNPGGREAVNIVPLSDNRSPYKKKNNGYSAWEVKKMNNDYWDK